MREGAMVLPGERTMQTVESSAGLERPSETWVSGGDFAREKW